MQFVKKKKKKAHEVAHHSELSEFEIDFHFGSKQEI